MATWAWMLKAVASRKHKPRRPHSPSRQLILGLLRNKGPLTPMEIASRLKLNRHTARYFLQVLLRAAQVERLEDGRYAVATEQP